VTKVILKTYGLVAYPPLDQIVKRFQDLILAIGSIPSLSSQDIFFLMRNLRLTDESRLANGRKSQKYKFYQINVRRKPFPNIIAESFSSTVIFFLPLENDSRDIS
jgi:hypothetical protein